MNAISKIGLVAAATLSLSVAAARAEIACNAEGDCWT